jgi:hypothetical protein
VFREVNSFFVSRLHTELPSPSPHVAPSQLAINFIPSKKRYQQITTADFQSADNDFRQGRSATGIPMGTKTCVLSLSQGNAGRGHIK